MENKISEVTKKLLEKAGGLFTIAPEVTDGKYSMADDGGVEIETAEFLYGLTRVQKPQRVLTTGVYSGISDMYIGKALVDNGFGRSTALEFERFHLDRARRLWSAVGVGQVIDGILLPSLQFEPTGQYELMFLDTEPQIRFAELVKFYPYLAPGGYVGIHDLPRSLCQGNINPDHPEMKSYPFGDLPVEIVNWIKDGDLLKIHFNSPRGMVFFYKPREDDHRVC